jgi:putative oxidoreductase
MILSSLGKYKDFALLWMRVGLGVMFVIHGWPKIQGGPAMWTGLGAAMGNFGITAVPVVWGFLAALSEFGGGICLVLGLAFRPACIMMAATMIVAAMHHLAGGDGVMTASHAIEAGVVFLGMLFLGPGRYSVDGK